MTNFMPPKKKLAELFFLPLGLVIFYFIYPHSGALILFSLGFIWNWSASNELVGLADNRRYRMSMLKLVTNLQRNILKPFSWAPEYVKRVIQALPAGTFWFLVISINDAELPWWPTFMGSGFCEIVLAGFFSLRKPKALP